MKKIIIAHSPDADDIFMYYAIKFGWVECMNTTFDNLALDIETLNVEALAGALSALASIPIFEMIMLFYVQRLVLAVAMVPNSSAKKRRY